MAFLDVTCQGDGRLVAAGSSRWTYNLLSTGRVAVEVTHHIFFRAAGARMQAL